MSTGVTPGQTAGYGMLDAATAGLPNFGEQGAGVADQAFGTSTTPQQNLLTGANTAFQNTLSPYLSSSYLNPMQTPGFGDALKTVNSDITNQVNDQFAAAGRDLSPGNTTALARGLSQGEGALISDQFNKNVAAQQGAAGQAFGGANTTAQGLTAQQLAQLQAGGFGLSAASAVPGLATQPGLTAEQIATMHAQQPFQNLGWLTSLAYPLGLMGGQSSGQGTSQGTTTQPWTQSFAQLGQGLGGMSAFMFSDERLKDDVTKVGMLYDGQPLYSYTYKGDDTPRIGLLAQEVEKVRPDAVIEIGPARIKAVDYGKATERARFYGMLSDLDMAA